MWLLVGLGVLSVVLVFLAVKSRPRPRPVARVRYPVVSARCQSPVAEPHSVRGSPPALLGKGSTQPKVAPREFKPVFFGEKPAPKSEPPSTFACGFIPRATPGVDKGTGGFEFVPEQLTENHGVSGFRFKAPHVESDEEVVPVEPTAEQVERGRGRGRGRGGSRPASANEERGRGMGRGRGGSRPESESSERGRGRGRGRGGSRPESENGERGRGRGRGGGRSRPSSVTFDF